MNIIYSSRATDKHSNVTVSFQLLRIIIPICNFGDFDKKIIIAIVYDTLFIMPEYD